MGLLPKDVPVRVSIAAWYWGAYLGDEAVNQGVNVCISRWRRISPTSFIPLAKGVGGYMNSTLAKIDAVENGYDDAIMLGDDGTVAEGSGQNIFIVKDNTIFTPTTEHCLNGITRQSVIQIAIDLGFEVVEKNLDYADLSEADEAFFTGTAVEITPITKLDNKVINTGLRGDITFQLQEKFQAILSGHDTAYESWLTYTT